MNSEKLRYVWVGVLCSQVESGFKREECSIMDGYPFFFFFFFLTSEPAGLGCGFRDSKTPCRSTRDLFFVCLFI